MRKKLLLFLAVLVIPTMVSAREITLKEFNYDIDGREFNYAVSETIDGGYVIVSDVCKGYQCFSNIVKYNKSDEIVWTKKFSFDGVFYDVDIDSKGNIYLGGYTYGDDTVYYNHNKGYVVKLDNDGKILWELPFGDESLDRILIYDLEVNDDRVVLVGENCFGADEAGRDENLGVNYYACGDAYYAEVTLDGKYVESGMLGGTGYTTFQGVTLTSDGGFVAVGATDAYDLPGSTLTERLRYSYMPIVVKYDKDNKREWVTQYPIDSGINEDNSCSYSFNGFYDVVEMCNGNYAIVGAVPKLSKVERLELPSSSWDLLNENLGLELDVEDNYAYVENDAAILVTYDKNGKKIKEVIESNEFSNFYSDILLLPSCDLLVTGNVGDHYDNSRQPNSLLGSSKDENLGYYANGCTYNSYDAKLMIFDEDLKEEWNKRYQGDSFDELFNISPVGFGEFVAVGGYSSEDLPNLPKPTEEADALIIRLKVTYEINVEETKNGSAVATNQHGNADVVYHGDTATITITPDEGYKVDTIKVVDSKGNEVPVEKIEKDKYEYHITDDTWVTVTFKNVEVVDIVQTGVKDFLIVGLVALLVGGIGYYLIDKKSVFKKM